MCVYVFTCVFVCLNVFLYVTNPNSSLLDSTLVLTKEIFQGRYNQPFVEQENIGKDTNRNSQKRYSMGCIMKHYLRLRKTMSTWFRHQKRKVSSAQVNSRTLGHETAISASGWLLGSIGILLLLSGLEAYVRVVDLSGWCFQPIGKIWKNKSHVPNHQPVIQVI